MVNEDILNAYDLTTETPTHKSLHIHNFYRILEA